MTYDPYERCRRSLERAQAEYDAMQPPEFGDCEPGYYDYDESDGWDELDLAEQAAIEAAERKRDES